MILSHAAWEFAGTFLLVFVIFAVGYSVAVGATLAGIVYFLSNRSGGHVNPAVSLAVWLRGDLPTDSFVSYVVAQIAGAAAAFGAAHALRV